MSSNAMIEISDNIVNSRDEAKTPVKINAFQFMMNSRHKVIGSNSPGKEKKDLELKSPEITEKVKEKLGKRKAIFEDWAEKKGGTKRKLADKAAEKHISKTLNKRAKRLKKMLDIIDEELKNSGEECSDHEEVIVKVKTKKRRVPIFVDSENSSNGEDINKTEKEDVHENDVKTALKHKPEKNSPVIGENNFQDNIEEKNNESEEPTIEKIKIFNSKSCEDSTTDNFEAKSEQLIKTSNKDINVKEKVENNNGSKDKKNNKTPEINSLINGNTDRNSGRKVTRKRSLSLKRNKDVEISTVAQENNSDNSQANHDDGELTDDEIFPTKKITTSKKSCQLKLVNDLTLNTKKNKEVKKECFSPRAWRMKVKFCENTENENKSDNKESEFENSEDQQSEENEPDKENDESNESENKEDAIVIEERPQKQVTNEEVVNSSGSESKKQVKLAPIFLKKQSRKPDINVLNAKKNFLHSGMPSKVKKLMTKSKSFQEPEYILSTFPKISHVQQRAADESLNTFWELPETSIRLTEKETNSKLLFDQINIGSFTNCKSLDINVKSDTDHSPPFKYKNLKEIVKEIKKEHPSYPIYKTFRILYQKHEKHTMKPEIKIEETSKIETPKPKRGRPKKKKEQTPKKSVIIEPIKSDLGTQMWTEKYRPQCQEDIIGNITAVQELKSWLLSWIRYSEDQKSSRKRRLSNSSDDFCSDSTTKDSDTLPQNLILLFGPLGSGKTCSVYGLCNELSINVIEINASSKRTGKKILADLQEATQSHQVKNTDSKSVNSFFQKKPDSQSEDDINKKLSLLLFEDVDIVFEDQDDNFISAVTTLVTCSKRPIILTYTDKKCPHLQKFILQYSVISFNSLSNKILGPWLQILCLVEGVRADKNMIDKLVQWNKGDVRKILLQLQFWTQTGGDPQNKSDLLENTESYLDTVDSTIEEDICVDDDNSNIPWMNSEDGSGTQNQNYSFCHQNCADSFIPYYERDKEGFKLSYPVNLEALWWNVPEVLGQNTNNFLFNKEVKIEKPVPTYEIESTVSRKSEGKRSLEELNNSVKFLESLAFADVVHTRLKTESYEEPIYNYWQINPVNSLSLSQNFSMYNETSTTSLEISHWLVENSVERCQSLRENKNMKLGLNNTVPYFEEVSWRSKRHKSMKELLSAVPMCSILDRRAICEDFQTILRSISRIENERSVTNSKRKNRFYHYLKNFNVHFNDSTYLLLCKTLATNHIE